MPNNLGTCFVEDALANVFVAVRRNEACDVLCRITARADVHCAAAAAGAGASGRQDVSRSPSVPPLPAASYNYAFDNDDDDDYIPPRYSDWQDAQRRRQVPEDDAEEMLPSPRLYPNVAAVADAYRWPPTANEPPLSVISGHLGGSAATDYGQAGGGVRAANFQLSLNDTSV